MGYSGGSGGGGGGASTVFARRTTSEIRNNNTILPDSQLVLPDLPPGTYLINGVIAYASSIAAGYRGGFLCSAENPANARSVSFQTAGGSTVVAGAEPIFSNVAAATNLEPTTTNTYVVNLVAMVVLTLANTISWQWAQTVTQGGVSTITRFNSWLSALKVE